MLKVQNIEVIYSDVILVLRGVSIEVKEGQIVTLLGANGAGKTTTLRAISGLLRSQQGEITRGTIEFSNQRIDRLRPDEIVRSGIIQVMEGRRLFSHLTVEENLQVGSIIRSDRASIKKDMEMVYQYAPLFKDLRRNISGYLSHNIVHLLISYIYMVIMD